MVSLLLHAHVGPMLNHANVYDWGSEEVEADVDGRLSIIREWGGVFGHYQMRAVSSR
jgi:hypothetical protein